MSESIPTVKGGNYRARRAPDGTWSILGVPIFADCERTVTTPNGMKITAKFDRAWQEKAVSRAKAKHAESGVMRAIYPRHKSAPGETRDVLGFFLPQEVRDMEIGGKRTAVTFADYVGVSDEAYRDLKSRKHPYKSVEAPIGTEPEFTGLAWLKEPPFHDDFPIQTVSEFGRNENGDGVVAFSNDAATVAALVRFSMPEIDEKPDETKPAAPVPPVAPAPAGEKPAAPAPAPGVEPEAKSNPVGELGAKVDAMTSMLTVLMGLMAKLSGGSQDGPMAGNRPGAVVGAFSAGGSTVPDSTPTTVTFNAETFAALQGENAALKARLETAEKIEKKRTAIAGAVAKVKGYLGATEADLVAQFDAGGETALNAYVAATVKFGAKDPDPAAFGVDKKGVTDPIVASFAGHESAAAEFGTQFDSLPPALRGGMSREAWITTQLGYVGVSKTEGSK